MSDALRAKTDTREQREHDNLYSHVTAHRISKAKATLSPVHSNSGALAQQKQLTVLQHAMKAAAASPLMVEMQVKHLDQLVAHVSEQQRDSAAHALSRSLRVESDSVVLLYAQGMCNRL